MAGRKPPAGDPFPRMGGVGMDYDETCL